MLPAGTRRWQLTVAPLFTPPRHRCAERALQGPGDEDALDAVDAPRFEGLLSCVAGHPLEHRMVGNRFSQPFLRGEDDALAVHDDEIGIGGHRRFLQCPRQPGDVEPGHQHVPDVARFIEKGGGEGDNGLAGLARNHVVADDVLLLPQDFLEIFAVGNRGRQFFLAQIGSPEAENKSCRKICPPATACSSTRWQVARSFGSAMAGLRAVRPKLFTSRSAAPARLAPPGCRRRSAPA